MYEAIRYSMVVLCLQGYMEPVLQELREWIGESPDKSPLAPIATFLVLNIFREFLGEKGMEHCQGKRGMSFSRTVLDYKGNSSHHAIAVGYHIGMPQTEANLVQGRRRHQEMLISNFRFSRSQGFNADHWQDDISGHLHCLR